MLGISPTEDHEVCGVPAHPKLRVLGNDLVVVFFRVKGEIVDRDLVVFDVLHDLLGRHQGQFRVGTLEW